HGSRGYDARAAVGTPVVLLRRAVLVIALGVVLPAVAAAQNVKLVGKDISLELDADLHSRVIAGAGDALGPFSASETVMTSTGEVSDFAFAEHTEEPLSDALGSARRHRIVGRAGNLEKAVEVSFYDEFPGAAVTQTTYTNVGTSPVTIASWTQNRYAIAATSATKVAAGTAGTAGTAIVEPAFWSYQTGSYERRPDWVLPLKKGFRQENFQGM